MSRRLNIAQSLRRQSNQSASIQTQAVCNYEGDDSTQSSTTKFFQGNEYRDELDFLEKFTKLKEPFTTGFLKWALGHARKTCRAFAALLRVGLFDFLLRTNRQAFSLEQLDSVVLYEFVNDLNNRTRRGAPIAESYRSRMLKAVSNVLEQLRCETDYEEAAAKVLKGFPRHQWPGFCHRDNPTPRLNFAHLKAIVLAAELEIKEAEIRLEQVQSALQKYEPMVVAPLPNQYKSGPPELLIAAFAHCFPASTLPHMPTFRRRFPAAAEAMGRRLFGYRRMLEYFVPTARTLLPFIVLTAVATAYNPATVLELRLQDIQETTRLGSPVIRIFGIKLRASEDPVITLDGAPVEKGFSLPAMFHLLNRLTNRLRSHIKREDHKNRLFVCVQKQPKGYLAPQGFSGYGSTASDIKVAQALKCFCKDHNLKRFSLKQIRPTILDEVHIRTGDLALAKRLGRHKRPETTWQHYTSDGTRKRYAQRLAEVFLLRERWRETNGCIDPRSRPKAMDLGAATPGFVCFDPFDSPRPNQRKEQLCKAYGECPSCPLAAARPRDPLAVSYYAALHKAIMASQSTLSPDAWVTRWAPVVADLNGLLGLVPDAIIRKAASFAIDLPPVG